MYLSGVGAKFYMLVSPVHGAIKVNYQCSLSGVGANIIVNIFS